MTADDLKRRRKRVLVGFRFKHHQAYSGYQRLAHHVAHDVYIDRDEYDFTSRWFDQRGLNHLNGALARIRNQRFFRTITRVLQDPDCGVIHFLYPENTLAHLPFQIPPHVTVVATMHQPISYFRSLLSDTSRQSQVGNLKRCDKVIALSKEMESGLRELYGYQDVRFIPHGVDTEAFPDCGTIRRTNSILILGSWLRDFDRLSRLVIDMQRQAPSISVTFVAADAAKSAIHRGLRNVRILRGISHEAMVRELNTHTILLAHYQELVASNALLEAASAGLPIVCNRLPAVSDYFGQESVYEVALENDRDISQAARDVLLLMSDDVRLAQLRTSARRSVQSLDWREIATKTAAYYGEMPQQIT